MIHLNQEQLRALQLVELELLTEFHRVCQKGNIRYTLTGGTLLGAVRHGGFIPWDDDSDVSMLREEYEKFLKACESELDTSKFYLQHMKNTPGYRWGYAKLRRKDTLFLRANQEHMPYEQGIFMDIFPRDGVPDGAVARSIHKIECWCIRKTLWSAVGRVAHPNLWMRYWYSILYKISERYIYTLYDNLVRRSNKRDTKLVRNLTFPIPGGYNGYLREWYQENDFILFEGKSFMVNKRYREWLTQEFGDYMKLPPKEKRKVHPIMEFRLQDSGCTDEE